MAPVKYGFQKRSWAFCRRGLRPSHSSKPPVAAKDVSMTVPHPTPPENKAAKLAPFLAAIDRAHPIFSFWD